MRLWIERSIRGIDYGWDCGQPRMRLWIERQGYVSCSCVYWVSLVWGCELKVYNRFLWILVIGSASYEAVNWKMHRFIATGTMFGQPRMRLWIESSKRHCPGLIPPGQPRMRLWIERLEFIVLSCAWSVSLVWGCELKDGIGNRILLLSKVSLVWGCELKEIV